MGPWRVLRIFLTSAAASNQRSGFNVTSAECEEKRAESRLRTQRPLSVFNRADAEDVLNAADGTLFRGVQVPNLVCCLSFSATVDLITGEGVRQIRSVRCCRGPDDPLPLLCPTQHWLRSLVTVTNRELRQRMPTLCLPCGFACLIYAFPIKTCSA
jgi:hypothetical protein